MVGEKLITTNQVAQQVASEVDLATRTLSCSNLRLSRSNLRRISESASNSTSSAMYNLIALNLQLGLRVQQLDNNYTTCCHSGNALQLAAGGRVHTRI